MVGGGMRHVAEVDIQLGIYQIDTLVCIFEESDENYQHK
jgi:hypothetical protein